MNMEEVIKYFESLEARLSASEARVEALEQELEALKQEREALKGSIAELEQTIRDNNHKIAGLVGTMNKLFEMYEGAPVAPKVEPELPTEPKEPVVGPEPVIEPEPEVEPEPMVEAKPVIEPELEIPEEPEVKEEPVAAPEPEEEVASPKAALYGKAVDDIRMAISLGDRFLYQRELFGQNAELMQRTLDELNGLSSFDEALEYIQSHFQWDTESNSYQQFLVTLHRRFG